MSDANTHQPGIWRPGDIANGHQLGSDGVWRPVESMPVPPGTQSPPPPPQVVVVQGDSNNTALAPVTGLVCASIAFLFCWIPVVGIIGWFFGPLGLLFGILGLRRGKAEHKIMSWIAIVLSSIALVICLMWGLATLAAVTESG